MRATNLHAFTVSLRREFPEAESLRIRRAKRASGTVFQLVGVHGNCDTIARQLKASNESEAFQGARELMLHLSGRPASKGSTKLHLRAALEVITSKAYRTTERVKVSGFRFQVSGKCASGWRKGPWQWMRRGCFRPSWSWQPTRTASVEVFWRLLPCWPPWPEWTSIQRACDTEPSPDQA